VTYLPVTGDSELLSEVARVAGTAYLSGTYCNISMARIIRAAGTMEHTKYTKNLPLITRNIPIIKAAISFYKNTKPIFNFTCTSLLEWC